MTAPLLAANEIRARKRPGIITAVCLLRAVLGLALAWPVCEIFARPTLAHPRGDAILFDAGGLYLVEAFRLAHGAATGALRGLSVGALLAFSAGLLPLGALLHALGRSGRIPASDLATAAVRVFVRFSVLLVMATSAMAFALLAALGVASAVRARVAFASDPAADLVAVGVWACAAILVAVAGVLHDLARAAVTQRDLGVLDAVSLALRALCARPAAALFGWAWRSALGAAIVVAAAIAAATIGVATSLALSAVALLHQAVVLGAVALRASWLACALRLVQAAAREASLRPNQGPEELLVATGRPVPADVQAHDAAP